MKDDEEIRLLVIASFPDSITRFRGDLISALAEKGVVVHVAVPRSDRNVRLSEFLSERDASLHHISLQRTGRNPFKDFAALAQTQFGLSSPPHTKNR